jgi:hypothetical protein
MTTHNLEALICGPINDNHEVDSLVGPVPYTSSAAAMNRSPL